MAQPAAQYCRSIAMRHCINVILPACLQDANNIVRTLEFGIGLGLNVMFMLAYLAVWHIDV